MWLSIAYTTCTVTIVYFVLGNSQAMRTAWVEDILSTIPQFAFLLAILFIRRPANRKHPYGYHRAMGVGHLVASVALIIVGGTLVVEAVSGLVSAEHPTIGIVGVAGNGPGFWWADSAAALLISMSIMWDGLRNTKAAVFDLMDERATTSR